MRKLLVIALALAISTVATQAQMVMYEDFESYVIPVGQTGISIHLLGEDLPGIARWFAQQNTDTLGDHGWSRVVVEDGDQCLKMTDRDTGGELDTVATAMAMWSMPIEGEGTIYMRYKTDAINANTLATNDLYPGWDYDGIGPPPPMSIDTPGWQGNVSNSYNQMGALCEQNGGQPFIARDGTAGYVAASPVVQMPLNTWIEIWIQVDHANDRTKYFMCVEGDTPIQAMNPAGGEWWAMHNETRQNDAVRNLKWYISNWDIDIETNTCIDTIGINQTAMTLERLDDAGPGLQADFDGDGDVDLDDFVILKSNFGTGTTHAEGDADLDGDVDLDDFVILKNEFGS